MKITRRQYRALELLAMRGDAPVDGYEDILQPLAEMGLIGRDSQPYGQRIRDRYFANRATFDALLDDRPET